MTEPEQSLIPPNSRELEIQRDFLLAKVKLEEGEIPDEFYLEFGRVAYELYKLGVENA